MSDSQLFIVEIWNMALPDDVSKVLKISEMYDEETNARYLSSQPIDTDSVHWLVELLHGSGNGSAITVRPHLERINPYLVIDLTNAPDHDKELVDQLVDQLFSVAEGEIAEVHVSEWHQPEAQHEGICISWKSN